MIARLPRWCAALALAIGCFVADAVVPSVAGADGAGPTNFESVIDAVDPSASGVDVSVVGGDSFLQVRAERGVTVQIPGYDGEPYLRIDADGSVFRNELSAATYLNQARDGQVELPERVDSSAEPEWNQIADGGEVAWHDHRIHWMLSEPPEVGADRLVQDWTVPVVVDGDPVEVSGRLLHRGDELPWALVVALLAGAGAVLLARRDRLRAPLLMGASAVALAVSIGAHVVNPPDSGASLIPVLLPALALGLALLTFVVSGSLRVMVLPLAVVAALAGWVIGRVGVLWMPFVPTTAPSWVDRAGTGLVLGVAVGVAVAILLWPVAVRQRSTGRSPSPQSVMPPTS